jgi:hypothetical protein
VRLNWVPLPDWKKRKRTASAVLKEILEVLDNKLPDPDSSPFNRMAGPPRWCATDPFKERNGKSSMLLYFLDRKDAQSVVARGALVYTGKRLSLTRG